MIYHDIKQNSDEWFALRSGRVTSSQISKVMANIGKAFGEPAKKYAQDLALERFMKKELEKDYFTTPAMEKGTELEPVARGLYEVDRVVSVKNGGFFAGKGVGDSPDGLVGENGVIEIKCPSTNAHWGVLKKGGITSTYKWQIHFHLYVTGRDWCDFISYNADFPKNKQLYIFRVEKDEEIQDLIKDRLEKFETIVEENIEILKK